MSFWSGTGWLAILRSYLCLFRPANAADLTGLQATASDPSFKDQVAAAVSQSSGIIPEV